MAEIVAYKLWNKTPFNVTAGTSYRFIARGKWVDWSQASEVWGSDIPELNFFVPLRRMRDARWFSLIGALDKDTETFFDIGRLIETGGVYSPTRNGTLYCFANDVTFMYWNNKGSIDLHVDEIPE